MIFTPDSRFMNLCTRLVELTKINLLWLLCCLPVFTAGAATTAMLTCVHAFRNQELCGGRVFFAAFCKHFRRSTALWLLILFFAAMLVLNYVIVAYLTFPGRMVVIVLIFFVLFSMILVSGLIFPLIAQFPGSIRETLVNAILLSLANLPKMLLITGTNLLPVLMLVLLPRFFLFFGCAWLICGFALVAWYDITVVDKILSPFVNAE